MKSLIVLSSLRRLQTTFKRVGSVRTYLSDSYRCQTSWENRLKSPLLIKLNLDELYHGIEQRYNQDNTISGVDVEVFTCGVNEDVHLDEAEDLVHKLRQSGRAAELLPSTGHNLIRLLYQSGRTDEMVRILHDRLNYGIFIDYHLSNVIMDDFLKTGKFAEAAKLAVLHGLQEDSSNSITSNLVLTSCLQCFLKGVKWELEGPTPLEEPKEEVKVRVRFLRNPYFDNHFDLIDGNALMGKTMAIIAPALENAVLANSLELLGWVKFGDWNKLEKRLNQLKSPVLKEAADLMLAHIAELDKEKLPESVAKSIASIKTVDGNLLEAMEASLKEAVSKNESQDIEAQEKKYVEWEETRQKLLAKQLRESEIRQKMTEIEKKKEYLREREQLLTFFDKEDQYNLMLEDSQIEEEQKKLTENKVAVEEEVYVPPEVVKRHTVKTKKV
ncbi:uncharacterized protein LOC135935276 [Cloeon dipterum]|uniref:uncharacterized protein LOC135935276 n=1 Tax=Cloeon dipterum TaxID=197152 RepID=UPI00321FE73F